MTNDLLSLNLKQARDALRAKKITSKELTQSYLDRVEKTNKELNAYITVTHDLALKSAQESDVRLSKGDARALEGVPLGIKDIFCTKDVLTTCGSKMLHNFIAPYESTVTQKLFDSGALMLGKLNMDEFAMGSSNLTSAYGPVVSPVKATTHDKKLVPGGSSGGSAAAVAGKLALGATGTDTGGSIPQPACFSGIVGVRTTYGLCSRFGMIAFGSSLDSAGPMARTVEDAAIMLKQMAGYDEKDSTSANRSVPDYESLLQGSIKGMRVGIPKEYVSDGMPAEIEKMWQDGINWLKDAGAEIVDVSIPHAPNALAAYYVIAPAEASSNLSRYDGVRYGFRTPDIKEKALTLDEMYELTRTQGFGAEVKRRIMIGTYVLSAGYYDAYYMQALKVRGLIRKEFDDVFQKVDVLLTPTTPSAAFAIGEEPKDPVLMYLNDIFTVPTSLAGLNAVAVPAGVSSDGLPLGLQVIGPAFGEAKSLNVAWHLERAANLSPFALRC